MTDIVKRLLPCPFCGENELSHGYEAPPEKGSVQCHGCDAYVVADTEAEAIAAWNRRTGDADEIERLGAQVTALRAALQTIADFAPGHGEVCEIIARRARRALGESEG